MNEKYRMMPYLVEDGVPNIKDSELIAIWERLQDENKLGVLFYDMNPELLGALGFVSMIKTGYWRLFLGFIEDELVGIGGLTNFIGKRAELHLASFHGRTHDEKVELFKWCLQEVLNYKIGDEYILDIIMGIIPNINEKILEVVRQYGFKEVGMLSNGCYVHTLGKSVDGVVIALNREV